MYNIIIRKIFILYGCYISQHSLLISFQNASTKFSIIKILIHFNPWLNIKYELNFKFQFNLPNITCGSYNLKTPQALIFCIE